jgi:predicted exporter
MSRRWLLIGGWLVVTAAAAWNGFLRTPLDTDMTAFLPPSGVEASLLETAQHGPAARTLIIVLGQGREGVPADVASQLGAALRDDAHFEWIATNRAGLDLDDSILYRYRYLISPALDDQDALRAPRLRAEMERRLAELASPLGLLGKQWLAADPTAEYRRLVLRLAKPLAARAVDGRPLLLARTRASALDLDAQEAALAAVRVAMERIAPGVRWQALGLGPFAVESRRIIRAETWSLTLTASLLLALLLRFGYRSWTPMWAAPLPLACAVAVGAGTTALLFGGLHGITVAFGVTLIGVGLDYPVHLFSHQLGDRSLDATARGIGRTLGLGAVTTALGYLCLTLAGLQGLAQLGTFAAAGLLAAALTARVLLPVLVPRHWRANPRLPHAPLQLPKALRTALLALAALLCLAAIWSPPHWRDDPAALSPVPARVLAMEQALRGRLGAAEPGSMLFVHGADAQALLQRSEALRPRLNQLVEDGHLKGYRLVSDTLPSIATQRARQARLPDAESLRAELTQAVAGLPFRDGLFEPFIDAVAAARDLAPLTPAMAAEDPLLGSAAALLWADNDGWSARVPLVGLADRAALNEAAGALTDVEWVDLRQAVQEGTAKLRSGAVKALTAGLALIALVLLLGLRSLPGTLWTLLPVSLALGSVLGIFSLLGLPLTLFHLITLVLVAGIAIDYALFLRRHGGGEGGATGHAVLLSAASTGAVFGILATSEIPVLEAIGSTAALGVAAALLLALALAPPVRPPVPADKTHQ